MWNILESRALHPILEVIKLSLSEKTGTDKANLNLTSRSPWNQKKILRLTLSSYFFPWEKGGGNVTTTHSTVSRLASGSEYGELAALVGSYTPGIGRWATRQESKSCTRLPALQDEETESEPLLSPLVC